MFGISAVDARRFPRCTASEICTVLVPDCFCTCMRTPGSAVDAQQRANVFGGVLHLGHVAHVDRDAASGHDHEIPDFVEVLELRLAAEQVGALALDTLRQAACSGSRSGAAR